MAEDNKKPLRGDSENPQTTSKKPWQPMRLTLAGDAKDVIRHGVHKTSPGTGDPGEIQKIPGGAEH
jgi:hypothetical protein